VPQTYKMSFVCQFSSTEHKANQFSLVIYNYLLEQDISLMHLLLLTMPQKH